MDALEFLKVESWLVQEFLTNTFIILLHDELGIHSKEDGSVKRENSSKTFYLAILGRLAKGTLIGVDARAECFGERSVKWAKGVLNRIISV